MNDNLHQTEIEIGILSVSLAMAGFITSLMTPVGIAWIVAGGAVFAFKRRIARAAISFDRECV